MCSLPKCNVLYVYLENNCVLMYDSLGNNIFPMHVLYICDVIREWLNTLLLKASVKHFGHTEPKIK